MSARTVRRLSFWTIIVGTAVLALKLLAWKLTGSVALLSDALESIVNVVASNVVTGIDAGAQGAFYLADLFLGLSLGLFGTYRKNETIDLQFTRNGKTELRSDLPVEPDSGQ